MLLKHKKCNCCGKRLGLFDKIIHTKSTVDTSQDIYMHDVCYYKLQLKLKNKELNDLEKLKNEEITDLQNKLDSFNYITLNQICNAKAIHAKKISNKSIKKISNKCKLKMGVDTHIEFLKNPDIQNAIYLNSTTKIGELFGMDVIVDENITGWYLK